MNKTTSLPRWHVFLVEALMLLLVGCGVAATLAPAVPASPNSAIPLSSPTPAPPYIHYVPSAYETHLEFYYPGYWYFDEEKDPYTGYLLVGLSDPEVLRVPTRPPDQPHGTPSDFGRIDIWIRPLEPGQTLESLGREQKDIDSTSGIIKLLQDYPLAIDGQAAYALETQDTIWEIYTSVMFNRRIIFIAYDQVYTLDFTVAEQDRGGRFEQGYEVFFESLKIVP